MKHQNSIYFTNPPTNPSFLISFLLSPTIHFLIRLYPILPSYTIQTKKMKKNTKKKSLNNNITHFLHPPISPITPIFITLLHPHLQAKPSRNNPIRWLFFCIPKFHNPYFLSSPWQPCTKVKIVLQ